MRMKKGSADYKRIENLSDEDMSVIREKMGERRNPYNGIYWAGFILKDAPKKGVNEGCFYVKEYSKSKLGKRTYTYETYVGKILPNGGFVKKSS